MSEQEIIREEQIFFSFDTQDSLYEIIKSEEDSLPCGSILHKKESRKEILTLEGWVCRFVQLFGYDNPIDLKEVYITSEEDTESLLFNGPFGSLKISRACNLTYERSTT